MSIASSANRHGPPSSAEHERTVRLCLISPFFTDLPTQGLPTPRANPQNSVNSLLSNFQTSSNGGPSIQNAQNQQPQVRQQQQQQQQQPFPSSGAAQIAENTPLDQMAPIDRWGLAGLLGTIRHENADIAGLAVGQDLTQLGLDLNSPEYFNPSPPPQNTLKIVES